MEPQRAAAWHVVAEDVGLSDGEMARLEKACAELEHLAADLDYLVPHLAANLGGPFLRALLAALARDVAGADPVIAALYETLRDFEAQTERRASAGRG